MSSSSEGVISHRRRRAVGWALGAMAVVLLLASGAVIGELALSPATPHTALAAAPVTVIKRPPVQYGTADAVPVLVYHEMDNGCVPTAAICNAKDPETVSTTQFTAEMNYLVSAGYHTITLSTYEQWLANGRTEMPSKPVLLTADNGIGSFLQGAQPILQHDGFTATAFLVSGFAYGAAGRCEMPIVIAGKSYGVQPGCGADNRNWDLTWAQLRALSPAVWNFALEAGPSGHFVQGYASNCQQFLACMIPGETAAQYENRVSQDLTAGVNSMLSELPPARVNAQGWVVPYSDLGYQRCGQSNCTPQNYDGPYGWLGEYASERFKAVFVEDAFRNGLEHERFRSDINGWMPESYFQSSLTAYTQAGDFDRTKEG